MSDAQKPHAWAVQGCSRMWTGEFAESDAKAEAARCGGTCYAYPLYTAPQSRQELQSQGKHPAPCARHCEAQAFNIEIRQLKARTLTHDAIRAAGAIVHADGNIFFTSLDKLNAAIAGAMQ